jgi:hypothetical protein
MVPAGAHQGLQTYAGTKELQTRQADSGALGLNHAFPRIRGDRRGDPARRAGQSRSGTAAGGQSHSALVAGHGLRVSTKWTDMPGACLGSVSAGNGVLNGLRVVCAGFPLLLLLPQAEFGAAGAVAGRSEARAGWGTWDRHWWRGRCGRGRHLTGWGC